MKPVALLCGTYEQYRQWALSHGLDRFSMGDVRKVVVPVLDPYETMGLEFSTYLIIGTFWDRPNAGAIYDYTGARIR